MPLFTSPLWLLALLPWAAVTMYLLWGRRTRQDVPYLPLWHGPVETRRAKTKLAPPPVALALAVVAVLLAILAAAGPAVRWAGATGGQRLTVIVDRGLTMSAQGPAGLRFAELARTAAAEMRDQLPADVGVDLLVVPGGPATPTDLAGWTSLVDKTNPTALDARDAVARLVARRLDETDGPVVVVSDADLGAASDDGRVVQYAPDAAPRNVAITHLAARATPRPQVMVRVRSNSDPGPASLRISAGGRTVDHPVDLPAAGAQRDYFISVDALGPVVTAEVVNQDDAPADSAAAVVREASWPVVDVARPVGELQRLIDLYKDARPAGEGSTRVRLTRGDARELGDTPGVAIETLAGGEGGRARVTRVSPHPVTEAVRDWPSLELPLAARQSSPPPAGEAGWTPVLWADDRVLVAVRESGAGAAAAARQVWTALDPNRWSNLPEYVVFWTGVLDWVGQGGDAYASHPLAERTPDWKWGEAIGTRPAGAPAEPGLWPGVYVREDGARRAFITVMDDDDASSAAGGSPALVTGRRGSLAGRAVQETKAAGRKQVSSILLVAAVACGAAAAGLWRRRGRRAVATVVAPASTLTPFGAGRTF